VIDVGRRKKVKVKLSPFFVIFLLIGVLCGVGSAYFVTKDDCFVMNGSKVIELELNATYSEQGVKVIEFGKDVSSKVEIVIYDENDDVVEEIDTSADTEYSVVYSIDSLKWEKYTLIRRVVVGGGIDE
jgi:hypothetical protein